MNFGAKRLMTAGLNSWVMVAKFWQLSNDLAEMTLAILEGAVMR